MKLRALQDHVAASLGKAMSREVVVIKPRRRKPTQTLSESALQIAVVEHLRRTAVPGCLFFSIPNEGKRSAANGARMKAQGMLPGVADLFVKRPDKYPLFLELKRKGKTPRKDQLDFADAAVDSGCVYTWTDNLDDALAVLRHYGAIRSR